MWTLTLPPKKF
ncbi:UNVERIFIED_CONTAM: hypothetical protein GTU68_049031 [Idotea baltica]|nr:hypothetical protein [Idotea baltica]